MVASEAASVVQPAFGVVGTDVVAVPLAKLLNAVLNSPENTMRRRNLTRCANWYPLLSDVGRDSL